MDEKKIVAQAQQGDRNAFAILVNEYKDRIYHLGLRLTGKEQDAEDILQETFIAMLQNINKFKGNSAFYTWLYRIAVNNGLKKLKSKANSYTHVSLNDPDVEQTHSEHLNVWPEFDFKDISNKKFRRELDKALLELPEKYRTVFILRDLHGTSTSETARILDISESNTKVRLMRARNFLKEKLEDIVKVEGLL